MSLKCPHCGGAISVEIAMSSDAIQMSNGQVAQMSLGSTKDGRKPYNQDYPSEFLAFWNNYPRHRDKRKALIAWRNAIRRASIDAISAGAIRYRNDPARLDEFTKYAEGWLNGDGWLDEPLPTRLGGKEPAPPTVTEDDYRRTPMTELREDMTKAIQHQIHQLARLRRCSYDVAKATVAQSFAEDLADSRTTSMEPYWEAMLTIADGL